ncbi:MAG: hypothetical protein ACUVXH_05480 [Anaerolineae bacterium]
MKDEPGKIITSLRHRLSIEAAMREMLEAASLEEFEAMAARIARQGAHQVVPVILANLDTTDARFRGVLGSVARYLDREEIAYALREVVMQPGRSDQERTTALMILDRYLGEEIGDSLYVELSDPLEVARQSLRELAAEAEKGTEAYEEYLRSLEDEPVDVALLVLKATQAMEPSLVVEPLRLLAQDPREAVAQEAIRLLGTLRVPDAALALRSLIPCLTSDRRKAAERALRKLALAGVSAPPPLPAEGRCRFLVSPVEGQGVRSVWVLERSSAENRLNLLTLMLQDGLGIVDCFGTEGLTEAPLTRSSAPGTVHRLVLPQREYRLDLLETDPGYAVRLLEEGAQQTLERQGTLPLEYRVWSKVLWKYDLPAPRPPQLPKVPTAQRDALRPKVRRLLAHPAFDSWTPWTPEVETWVAAWRGTAPPNLRTAQGATLVRRLVAQYYQEEALEACRRRLLANSEWFLMAGEREMAELALVAAEDLDPETRTEHPLLLALAERAFLLVWDALQRGESEPVPKQRKHAPRPVRG